MVLITSIVRWSSVQTARRAKCSPSSGIRQARRMQMFKRKSNYLTIFCCAARLSVHRTSDLLNSTTIPTSRPPRLLIAIHHRAPIITLPPPPHAALRCCDIARHHLAARRRAQTPSGTTQKHTRTQHQQRTLELNQRQTVTPAKTTLSNFHCLRAPRRPLAHVHLRALG